MDFNKLYLQSETQAWFRNVHLELVVSQSDTIMTDCLDCFGRLRIVA